MLISVEFWKSMHGFAKDSRTRGALTEVPPRKDQLTYILPKQSKPSLTLLKA